MAFNPDDYLADKSGGFNPDAYLASKQPAQAPVDEQAPVIDELPEGGLFETITEPVTAISAGAAGQVFSGLSGIPAAITGDTTQATETIKETQEVFSEIGAPTTKAGTEALKTVGDFVQAGIDIASVPISMMQGFSTLMYGLDQDEAIKTAERVSELGIGGAAAERSFEATGSPLLSTIIGITPELIGSIIPVTKIAQKNIALRTKIADRIKAGETDKDLAFFMLDEKPKTPKTPEEEIDQLMIEADSVPTETFNAGESFKKLASYIKRGAGGVKKDRVAIESVKQGFDQGVIAAVKGASPSDRAKMLDMVKIRKKGKENALYGMKNRPSDIAGNSLLARVNHVKSVNRQAGSELDGVAKSLKGQEVDFDKPINDFLNDLDEMGISIDDNLKPTFKGSDVEGLAAPENAIKNIINRLASGTRGKTPDAYELHRMKKYIDETVTYGKQGEGLAGKTERILKKLRRNLDQALDEKFPEYNRVNTTYADTVGALDSLQDVAGKKMDLFGSNAEKAVGTLLRRLMSNAQSRVNLVDAVDSLENTAKKYGGKFDDDISTQMLFTDELDSVFGVTAKSSLAGEVGKGVRKGVETAGGQRSIFGTAMDVSESVADKARGINEENAFKTIEKLLSR